MDFLEYSKAQFCKIIEFCGKITKNKLRTKLRSTDFDTFFFGNSPKMFGPGRNIIWPIFGREMSISTLFWPSPTGGRWKNGFFAILPKFVQNMFRYQILLRNRSTVPQILISGHIMTFRTLSATLSKKSIFP